MYKIIRTFSFINIFCFPYLYRKKFKYWIWSKYIFVFYQVHARKVEKVGKVRTYQFLERFKGKFKEFWEVLSFHFYKNNVDFTTCI